MEKELQAPLVHLNGTSKEMLLEELENAYSALGEALDKLRRTAPNGRDYYVLQEGSLKRAEDEHRDRMVRIDSVRKEIECLVGAIDDGETKPTMVV